MCEKDGKGYDKYGNIIFELKYYSNGYIREYGNSNLLFEGEYLNGKINKKRKENYYDKLSFESKYVNGK